MSKNPVGPIAKLHEYGGETRTAAEWAKAMGISVDTFRERMRKFEAGQLSCLDDVYKVPRGRPALKLKANEPPKVSKGIRTKITGKFFEMVQKHLEPQLEEEFITYKQTGECGPAMNFFFKYKDFFPKDKSELLDGETNQVATVAVVVNSTAPMPTNFTVIDN